LCFEIFHSHCNKHINKIFHYSHHSLVATHNAWTS
jgi:hypothetical protein